MQDRNINQDPVKALLHDLDAFFYGENHWQAGLNQLVAELSYDQAIWKPSVDRHCIWEIVKHINFWKIYAIAYITDKEKPDPNKLNWVKIKIELTPKDWQDELENLKKIHEEIKNVISAMGLEIFDIQQRKSNYIRQIICHDSYHSGQIGLLRVMQGLKPIE